MLIIIVIKLSGKRNAKQYRSVRWMNAINTKINSLITESLLKSKLKYYYLVLILQNTLYYILLYFVICEMNDSINKELEIRVGLW